MTFAFDNPFNCDISIYGLANKLIIAARVIRIICATITSVRVNAGNTHLYIRSINSVSAFTFASDGNTGQRDAKNKINKYARKNSGKEIVVSVTAFTERS